VLVPGETAGGFAPRDRGAKESMAALEWRRARCGAAGACVEIASLPQGRVAIRDGKSGDDGPVLVFTQAEWDAFTAAIRTGELS
jgi:uncharacterized protein DUF397